ncbi:MAG: protein translocase subunit SecDF [Bacteroidales bacterium]|jgi:SecD/SecF fusion protein|nr:protein translocase subunit SecDF [Bacteroidales bacterium]
MQNKGAIKFFAIIFALICAYQLSFTLITQRIEKKATAYSTSATVKAETQALLAGGDAVRERFIYDSLVNVRHQYFLDSVSNSVVYNIGVRKYTFKECKERELNLGLDLRGGMNVMMEVSIADVVRALASHSMDPMFNTVMEKAIEKNKVTANSDFVSMFAEAWKETDANAQMSAIFSWEMKTITANSTNDEVIAAMREETRGAFDRTYQILRQRIDKFGVAQPNIQKLERTQRILIELPGVKEPERVRKLLQGTAQLEFWETYEFAEIAQSLVSANEYLASAVSISSELGDLLGTTTQDTVASPDTTTAEDDIAKAIGEETSNIEDQNVNSEEWRKKNPLFAVLYPSLGEGDQNRQGPVAGYAQQKDIATVNILINQAMAANKLPRNAKFVWSAKPIDPATDLYSLIVLKVNTRDGRAPLTGDVITDARQDYGQSGSVDVSMTMNSEGAKIWKNMTGANVGRSIAVVLDNYAYSWPNVNQEIAGGQSQITGTFSVEEGKDLANILKAGKLPAPAQIVQEAVVGPSLGQQAINSGMMSFLIAFIMVLAYMLFFYNKAGIVANVALLTNLFFLFGVLASLGAVLTLPGIAGIVLTFGMAIDANVIIYERIKEEIRSGKGVRLAIADGYKNSYSAIIDGNVTTLLTAVILYIFGTGPIQGFATTLTIGILTSLFTAIFITRLVITWMLDKNYEMTFDNKIVRNFLQNTNFDVLKQRKFSYVIAVVMVALSIGFLSTRGLSLGIDFKGGRTYVVRFDQNVEPQDVRNALTREFGDAPEVKTFGPSTQVKISTKYKVNEISPEIDQEVEGKLYNGVKSFYNEPISLEDFNSEQDGKLLGKLSSEMVGPSMATDITRSAVIAVVIALFGIFVYIAIRFKKWQFGLGGAVALLFNAVFTLGVFSMFYGILPFSMEIDQSFIAAILTVIGYAINDTVIIFDRIRENMGLYPKHNLRDQMNNAFNATLSRTFNTSFSTLLVLLIIFVFGGEVIRGFTFALMFGIAIGTLSTYFIASPIAFDAITRWTKKK